MASPFFSVVIPVYNRAGGLQAAIESVLTQTFQDFEVIVIDDGSDDDPHFVVDGFADPRLRIIRQANAGGGAARNRGIDNAKGQFIAFLDSDDIFLQHHLADMHAFLRGTVNHAAYARVWVDRGQGPAFLKPPRAIRPGEDMACYLLCDRGFTQTSAMAVPVEAARRVRFSENLRAAEDTDFAIRLYLLGCQFQMLDKAGAVWNDRNDPSRTSSDRGIEQPKAWLERIRPMIPPKAYHGARGWMYAKRLVRDQPLRALGLYLNAVVRGCYRPSLAGVVFLQIFLGFSIYRRFVDRLLALGLRRLMAASTSGIVSEGVDKRELTQLCW